MAELVIAYNALGDEVNAEKYKKEDGSRTEQCGVINKSYIRVRASPREWM